MYEGSTRVVRIRIDNDNELAKEYLINNYLGSPVAVVADNEEVNYQKYLDPYGNMEMEIGKPSSNIELQYMDKELDRDSGLYYFHARYYDSVLGRFLGRDKVKLEDNVEEYFQINPYQYCANSPLKYVDMDGNKNTVAANFARKKLNTGRFKYGTYDGWEKRLYTELSERDHLVCNEYVMFAYRGSGIKDFPYETNQWQEGIVSQMDWFSQREELFPVNSTDDLNKLTNFGEGDVIFFSEDGTSKTVKHVVMVDNYNAKTGEITFMGAHGSKSNIVGKYPKTMTVEAMKDFYKREANYSHIAVGSIDNKNKNFFNFFGMLGSKSSRNNKTHSDYGD